MKKIALLALVTAGLFPGLAQFATAEIYRWVDATGRVHFGDRPQHQRAEKVEVNTAISEQRRADAANKNLQLQQLYREFKQQDSARLAQEQKLAEKKSLRDKRCQKIARSVSAANTDYAFYRVNEDGSKAYLTDQEIEAYRSEVRAMQQKHCAE